MLIRSWLFSLARQFARRHGGQPQNKRVHRVRQFTRACEVLEDRTLLAASIIFAAEIDTPRNLTLLLAGSNVQIVDSSNSSRVLATESLAWMTFLRGHKHKYT